MGRGKKRVQTTPTKQHSTSPKPKKPKQVDEDLSFTGPPLPMDDAKTRWPHRYKSKSKTEKVLITLSDGSTEEKNIFQAKRHYTKASVDGVLLCLYDNAYIQAGENETNHIAKIVEMFETVDEEAYICTQWFYRAKDTVIGDQDSHIDSRRVFYSDIKDDNPLSCIYSKVTIDQLMPEMDSEEKKKAKASCELYVDMMYSFPHAFTNFYTDDKEPSVPDGLLRSSFPEPLQDLHRSKVTLLDLYSGCGAMSSGLAIGASLDNVEINTRWAVDFNECACKSLKYNHPHTEVRNEDAEDYLLLLKEWVELCKKYDTVESKERESETEDLENDETSPEVYEVEKLLAISYGNPEQKNKKSGKKNSGLHFKVRWKGFGKNDDTWEPQGNLNCEDKIREFVVHAKGAKLIPLPGDVDIICGGPPCQGISGFNRFRDTVDPLSDKKNRQLIVFMNIVEFLKPRYVLMENVTDILKFAKGLLTRYAVGRLVSMDYQARLGIMAAGAYGVPQCRMRFFLWGAGPKERLPQFPLPTHRFLKKGVVINEFKEIIVGHETEHCELLDPVLLGEAISDLPKVTNDAEIDAMPYGSRPCTTFQKNIRLPRSEIFRENQTEDSRRSTVYDHRPLKLSVDDYERVCRIPLVKGANFRDLGGLIVDSQNRVQLDPNVERPLCRSGKPLVPDYALSFEGGKSLKPFGRLWMDEIVATVVTRGQPHNQAILHPNQQRVLSARENARLQGFPDCYKLNGSMKERYMQVGNAVAFSVSIALGFCLSRAMEGANNDKPLRLPFVFPECLGQLSPGQEESEESNA